MTDAKSAMLEIALRAVQQHLERDEYTEAGDVVMQALARAEQVPAPDLRATFRDTMDSLDMAELAAQQTVRIAELEKLLAASAAPEVWCGCGDQIMPDDGARCGTCVAVKTAAPKGEAK